MKRIFASVFLAMTVLITGCSADRSNAAPDNQSPVTGINSSVKNSSESNESEFVHTQISASDSAASTSSSVSAAQTTESVLGQSGEASQSAPEIIQSTENNSAPQSVTQSVTSTPQHSSEPQPPQSVPESTLPNSDPTEGNETNKILVVYFSCTNTTKKLAEYAADILGADIYEIIPVEPYTEADLAYYTNGRADREQADPAVRPAISGSVSNMSNYDTIILGYPIWHGQAPRIISTFLESYDFSGKTIAPFCTSHSSGIGSSAENLHSLCSAEWLSGQRFGSGTSRGEVEKWLKEIGITDR